MLMARHRRFIAQYAKSSRVAARLSDISMMPRTHVAGLLEGLGHALVWPDTGRLSGARQLIEPGRYFIWLFGFDRSRLSMPLFSDDWLGAPPRVAHAPRMRGSTGTKRKRFYSGLFSRLPPALPRAYAGCLLGSFSH